MLNCLQLKNYKLYLIVSRAELWLKACKRSISVENLYNNFRICGEHFAPAMFLNDLKNRLQPHAVPVINIPRDLESSLNGVYPIVLFCIEHKKITHMFYKKDNISQT